MEPGITRELKKVWNICARQKKTRSAEIITTKSGWITETVIQPELVLKEQTQRTVPVHMHRCMPFG